MSDQAPAVLDNGKTDLTSWEKTLADFKSRYSAISVTDKEQYEPRRLAVAEMRKVRTAIEERRLELGRPLLKAKKDIDDKANWLKEEIWKIEAPLKGANEAIDEEAARLKRIADQDERDKLLAAQKAAFDAHAARQTKESEDERARLKAEAEKLAADKAKADADAKAERERLAAEKAKADAEIEMDRKKAALVMAENNRQREELAAEQKRFKEQKEAADKAERDRLAAAEAERRAQEEIAAANAKRIADEAARLERERLEASRLEAIKPDIQKVREFADIVDSIIERSPSVTSDEAFTAVTDALAVMAKLAEKLRGFGS